MALPRLKTLQGRDGSDFQVDTNNTPLFVQKMVDPTFGGKRNASFGSKFLSAAYRGVLHTAAGAHGGQADFISPGGKGSSTSGNGGFQNSNDSSSDESSDVIHALHPLNTIAARLTNISEGISQIVNMLKNRGSEAAGKIESAGQIDNGIMPSTPHSEIPSTPHKNQFSARSVAPANTTNDNQLLGHREIANESYLSEAGGFINRSVGAFRAAVGKKQSNTEEGTTSNYSQNEKSSNKDDEVQIDGFADHALKQLGEVFEKAFGKVEDEHKDKSGFGGLVSALVSGIGGVLTGFFGGKLMGGAKNLLKGAEEAGGKFLKGAKSAAGKGVEAVEEEASHIKKLPSDLVERAKAQLRGPDGRFIKQAGKVAEEAEAGISKVGGGIAKFAGKASGLLKVGSKVAGAAGLAAIPLTAGLDFMDRKKAGQNNKQAVIGAGATTGGMVAGASAGAEGGAIVGGGIGALFGGVGAVPGAAIGSVVGGIGGGIAGSKAGGWIADKFMGIHKPNAPTAQSKDLVALQKAKEKKQAAKAAPAPIVVSAPSTTTNITNQSATTMVPGGGDTRGPRGSLDLNKY